mmetsp:Transcript_45657/g.89934  ORF Transcript_45657/g.89934 Transcript_45657/m.89934 type:complete len:208 (-) Transcript_45657:290-913(-)
MSAAVTFFSAAIGSTVPKTSPPSFSASFPAPFVEEDEEEPLSRSPFPRPSFSFAPASFSPSAPLLPPSSLNGFRTGRSATRQPQETKPSDGPSIPPSLPSFNSGCFCSNDINANATVSRTGTDGSVRCALIISYVSFVPTAARPSAASCRTISSSRGSSRRRRRIGTASGCWTCPRLYAISCLKRMEQLSGEALSPDERARTAPSPP